MQVFYVWNFSEIIPFTVLVHPYQKPQYHMGAKERWYADYNFLLKR